MPSFLVHAVVPTLAMLAARRWFDPRVVLLLWPFTILPDVDYFGDNGTWWVHRATLSNVFVAALLVAATYWGARRWAEPGAAPMYARVAAVYLGSHILMDLFVGGVVLFWPLWDRTFLYWLYVEVDTRTNEPVIVSEPATHEGAPVVSETYLWLSPFETAMAAFLLVFWLAVAAAAWRDRRRRLRAGPRQEQR